MGILYIPKIIWDAYWLEEDVNRITYGKSSMEGKINASCGKTISMPHLKQLSKKLGVTINDIMVSSVGVAMKELLL